MVRAPSALVDPRHHAALAAVAVITLSVVGFGVSMSQGIGCEFDCRGPAFDDPVVTAIVQGTAYNGPAPFLAATALAAFLATRAHRGAHLTGLGLLTAFGLIQVVAIIGEPWVQRAFTSLGGMTLAASLYIAGAIAMGGLGARGLLLSARKRAT